MLSSLQQLLAVASTLLAIGLGPAECLQTTPEADPGELIAEDSWVMVIMPDTQSYVDHSEHMPVFDQITQWIADSAEDCNIELVLHVGDIVYQNSIPVEAIGSGDQNSEEQWTNSQRAMHRLNGIVPYIMATGNHDYGINDSQDRRTQFDEYFTPQDNPLVAPAQGGILAGMGLNAFGIRTLENACYDFTAPDGRQFLFFSLEWGPRQAVVDWASRIAGRQQYQDHTKVLLTHAYLYHDNTRYDWRDNSLHQRANPHGYYGTGTDTNDGEELWNKLVKLHSFELVFSGHVGGDMVGYLTSQNNLDQTVHQMLFNAQFLPNGGQGWIRLLEFMGDGRTVHVRTFSPFFAADGDDSTSAWRISPDDDFFFELSSTDFTRRNRRMQARQEN